MNGPPPWVRPAPPGPPPAISVEIPVASVNGAPCIGKCFLHVKAGSEHEEVVLDIDGQRVTVDLRQLTLALQLLAQTSSPYGPHGIHAHLMGPPMLPVP